MSYMNLKAEMVKHGITQQTAASFLGMSSNNLSMKIREKVPFTVEEAKSLRDEFFPTAQLDYLFQSDGDVPSDAERAKSRVQVLAENIENDGTPMDDEKAEIISDLLESAERCDPAHVNHVLRA